MLRHARGRFAALAAAVLLLGAAAAHAAPPQIVLPAQPPAAGGALAKSRSDAAPVRFNAQQLFALKPGDEAQLTLPDGTQHTFVFEKSVDHGGGIVTWIARSKSAGDSGRAIVTTGPGGTWGSFSTPHAQYGIYPGSGGVDWLRSRPQRDLTPKFPGGDAIAAPRDPADTETLKGNPTSIAPQSLLKSLAVGKSTPADVKQVDVMIIYTKDLAQKLGAGLLPMLYNLVAAANQAYSDSEIALSLRLVNATMLDLPNANGSGETLDAMAGQGSASLDAVFQPLTFAAGTSVRDRVGADIVALVRDGPTDTGGIGFVLKNQPSLVSTSAYSVSNYCASGCEDIFTHELGHNMGDAHDRSTVAQDHGSQTSDGVYPYSYGHYSCQNGLTCTPGVNCSTYPQCASQVANDFGTVMAYVPPRVMKFSNPNVTCVPTGGDALLARACGVADQDDNARSMNDQRQNISAYRNQAIAALPGSLQFTKLSYTGSESGGTIAFTVSRASGSSGAVSVHYALASGTATAGADFVAASGTLSWASGDSASKTITVPLTNDLAPEGVEAFTATLSSPSGATGVYLGYPSTASGLIAESWPTGSIGALPPGFSNPAGSSATWAIANDDSADGDGVSLKSGALDFSVPGCTSSFGYGAVPCPSATQVIANLAAGDVAFNYRVSAFPGIGFFELLVDGTVAFTTTAPATSSETGWQSASVPVTAGTHMLTWRYRTEYPAACRFIYRDPLSSPEFPSCADRAWIDTVSLPLPHAASATTLSSSANPSVVGQSLSLTASVSVGGGSATGTVAFRDGANAIAGCGAVNVASNTATCATSALAAGAHTLTASYSGNSSYSPSTSAGFAQTVLGTVQLTLSKSGSGSGTVTSAPAGIDCGATCTANVAPGSAITLSAAPSVGSVFMGWSGAGCSGAGTCTIAPSAATTVMATFNALAGVPTAAASPSSIGFGAQSVQTTSLTRTVSIINAGTGTLDVTGISSSDAQFVQANDCAALASGAHCTVTLRFTPAAASAASASLSVQTSGGTLALPLSGTGELSLVTHYYQAILNREPDASGKGFWDGEAARMGSLGADLREAYFVMANYFFNSPEYQSYGKSDAQFVTDLYNTFFNRPPDGGGLSYWTGQIAGGMPRDVVLFSFMFSPEFQTFTTGIFGNTAARPEVNVVMDFFRGILNRLPDTAAFNFWVGQLRAAQCQGQGAVYDAVNNISYSFIFGAEYSNRARNNTQYVTDLYNAFLRRGGDTGGVNFWIGQLDANGKDRNTERTDFMATPEFAARVNDVVNAGCLP